MTSRAADWFEQALRSANSHADGPPFEHFGAPQSDEALRNAREIIELARFFVAAA